MLFYEYKKIDYGHEKESFEIMNKISFMVNGTNTLHPELSYMQTSQTIKEWPGTFTEMGLGRYENIAIPTEGFDSLESYIAKSRDIGLTHIIIDDKEERPDFLKKVFSKESDYPYLEKIYDSKSDGFVYNVKVFKIDYR